MVEELLAVQANPMTIYGPFISLSILTLLAIYGTILLLKSKQIRLKSLKIGILIPLIIFILGIIWWIGDNIFHNPFGMFDFGGYIFIAIMLGGIPASILSIIFSAISLSKLQNKVLPILTIVYGIIYFIISLISMLNFRT